MKKELATPRFSCHCPHVATMNAARNQQKTMKNNTAITAPRSSGEIVSIFTAKGCTVEVEDLGHSYRAGGEIFIHAPGVDPSSQDGFTFAPAGFAGFDGTGYDGRGRQYTCWLVTAGDFIPATPAEFANAAEDRRIRFGAESRSCGNTRHFVHRDEVASTGLADLGSAFAALGL